MNENIIAEANFELIENSPIEVTFEINPTVGDSTYIHYQDVPANKWNVTHNLNKFPSVTIVTSAGDVVMADVCYIDMGNIEIKFSAPFAGRVYLN